ncbi:MAG: hypothetical protein GF401_03825 [Chitinivibrionales bacterium]|nr:hypothetical protein [Chitinivibrionales bacterium]
MGKKNKKKQQLPSDPTELERLARQHLAAGRYRNAKNAFKELHKKDPAKYLPDLIEAYKALARDMISRGRMSDAEPVLDYIQQLTGSKMEPSDLWTSAAPHATLDATHHDTKMQRLKVADESVVSFARTRTGFFDETSERECAAVQDALRYICSADYRAATDAVRGIPLKSMFSHWRLFIKALCAFYRHDDDTLRAAFSRIPEGTAPYEALRSCRYLIDRTNSADGNVPRSERLARHAGILAGFPGSAPALARIDYLWDVGRFRDALREARRTVPEYSTAQKGIAGRLRHFLEYKVFDFDDETADKYLEVLFSTKIMNFNHIKPENREIALVSALISERMCFNNSEIENVWTDVIELYRHNNILPSGAEALIHLRLGKLFAKPAFDTPLFFPRRNKPEIEDEELATEHLKTSINLYDNDLEAYKTLLYVYTIKNRKAERNRLLDTMSAKFPEDKETLEQAGLFCLQRKAYKKALGYFRQAMDIDPTDKKAAAMLNVATLLIARNAAESGRVTQMRKFMRQTIENSLENSMDFNLNRSAIMARWAVLESIIGDEKEVRRIEQCGRNLAPTAAFYDYFIALIASAYAPRKRHEFETFEQRALSSQPTVENALSFVKIVLYGEELGIPERRLADRLQKIDRYCAKAVSSNVDPQTAQEYIELVLSMYPRFLMTRSAKKLVKMLLKKDGKNPAYLLYNLLLDMKSKGSVRQLLSTLEQITEEAEKRGDMKTLTEARKLSDEIHSIPFMDGIPGKGSNIFERMLNEFEDEDYFDDEDEPGPMPPPHRRGRRTTHGKANRHKGKNSPPSGEKNISDDAEFIDIFNDLF